VSQYHFDPTSYGECISEVEGYDELQAEVAAATADVRVERMLELGTGTGVTARRVLALHPGAGLVGIDESDAMLTEAGLPGAELLVQRLEDPLPSGPFDLVFSALAVHHLDGAGKRDLFRRVASELRPSGRFVLGDVVVPERDEDAATPLTPDFDLPDRVEDQLEWLADAGFAARVTWRLRDLAVIAADRR
jgi:tRNA (cmo5U34)-methyltransferase